MGDDPTTALVILMAVEATATSIVRAGDNIIFGRFFAASGSESGAERQSA